MLFTLLDVVNGTWLGSNHHLLLMIIALVSIIALAVIFIYRRKKNK